jgi:hypothetical protein
MPAVKAGIVPRLVVEQVKNTAAWLWEDPRAAAVTGALDRVEDADRARLAADAGTRKGKGKAKGKGKSDESAPQVEAAAELGEASPDYLKLLLAAHFSTVATFVPTDVDARIRHHAWMAILTPEALGPACDVIDEVASWDARWVSARALDVSERDPQQGSISGIDGEWLGVRAGALGRAMTLGAADTVERLVADLDRELDREERVFVEAFEGGAPARRVLSAATILAHNLGDLSRVAEAWPGRDEIAALRARYVRLGHPDTLARRPAFVTAGALNKALMAIENHRFLALRKPRGLRAARSLLLPIGPWFDAWGEAIARDPALEDRDRAEVVTALLEIHGTFPEQHGCLRALSGIHRATRGGLELHVPNLPARLRKDALRGRVREAMDVAPDHFDARLTNRYRVERDRVAGTA